MLFSVVNNPAISANELNHDLKVNPDLNKQATELLFSCKKNSPNHPSLFFNESVVPKVKGTEAFRSNTRLKVIFRLKKVLE